MHKATQFWRATLAIGLAALCGFLPACDRKAQGNPDADKDRERTEDMSWGPVQLSVSAEPGRVQLHRDIALSIRITAPSEVDVELPPLNDRLKGFELNGQFEEEAFEKDGKRVRQLRALLKPVLADEYRLAPLAVRYTDKSRSPAETRWFPTRPMVFEYVPPVQGDSAADIHENLQPVWIRPSLRSALWAALGLLAAGGLGYLLWRLIRKAQRRIRILRMSPRERALHELKELLEKNLIGQDRIKEFYLELTMIVRRYIERQHSIRAPEQTTEEFLAAATAYPRFSPEVIRKLRAFLEAADLVKFAAHHPDTADVNRSTATAREYIETDSAPAPAENAKGR